MPILSSSPIPQVYKSLVRSTVDLITEMNATGNFPATQYQNWEERGEESALPQVPLLGVDGFTFTENQGLWVIHYALGLSSYRDANLLTEIEMIGYIHSKIGEMKKIPLLDLGTGSVDDELVISEFQVLPMSQSELRNYRTIGVRAMRTSITR